MRKFLFFGVTGLLLILGIFFINLFAPDEVVNTHTQSYLIPTSVTSPQIKWNGDALIDSTVIDDASNTCTAERNGMKIEIKPCVAFDIDGRDLEQYVNFTWSGNNEQNIGWIFVYDGQLQKGGISAILNSSHTETRVRTVSNWINNYLVSNVVSYIDLGTPDERCEMGNTNNTRMYDVTHQNATATYNKVYCFTSSVVVNATAFRISGNYNTEEYYAYTSFYPDWKDVTSAVEFLGVGLLDDNRSYYKVQSTTFQPNQSLYTRWSYTPKDNLRKGKWHILGYNADIGLVASLTSGQYIYVDPWWNNDWDRKKEIKVQDITGNTWTNYSVYLDVTYDADMSANFSDLRFLDATETYEIPYYIESKTDSTSAKVWVKTPLTASSNTSIFMYYGHGAVSTTGNKTASFLWNDDAEADWTSRYTVVGGTPIVWNYTGSEYNFQGANTDQGHTIYPTGLNCSNCSVFAETRDVTTKYVAGLIMRTTGSNNGYKMQKVNADLQARVADIQRGVAGTTGDYVYFNGTVWAFGTTINYSGQGTLTWGSVQFTNTSFSSGYGGWWNADDGISKFKRLRIREYMSPEPVYYIGAEQSLDLVSMTISQDVPNNLFTNDNTVTLRCNYTSTAQNITGTRLNVYNSTNFLSYSSAEGTALVYSINKTWTTTALTDGVYNWACYGNGSLGVNGTTGNYTFTVDTTNPVLNITYPINNSEQQFFSNVLNSTFNYTLVETNPSLCWFNNGSSNFTIICGTNISHYYPTGWNILKLYANDSAGNSNTRSVTFFVNNITKVAYNLTNTITESYPSKFYLNVSATNTTTINASITYNNTLYAMTEDSNNGTYAGFSVTVTSPSVTIDTKVPLWFNYTLFGITRGTANTTQLVYNIGNLTVNCTNPSLNFILNDEETLTGFTGTFDFNIKYGVTNPLEVNTFGTYSGTYLPICINTTVAPNFTIGYGEIMYQSSGYEVRRYYMFSGTTISNITQNITIYSLLTASQTTFQLNVKDTSQDPYIAKYTQLQRWYPDLNEYRTVDMGKTDESGNTIIHVDADDIDYKIGLYETNGTLIKLSEPIRMFCTSTPCTYNFIVGDTYGNPVIPFNNITSLVYGLLFNKTTKMVTYTYNDTHSDYTVSRLFVQFQNNSGVPRTVCNVTNVSSVGIITCNLSNYTSGEFVARAYNKRTVEKIAYLIRFEISQALDTFGLEGLILGWFIVLTASMIFLANKIAGIIAVNAAFILVRVIGFIEFSGLFIFSLIGISIILIVIFKQGETY